LLRVSTSLLKQISPPKRYQVKAARDFNRGCAMNTMSYKGYAARIDYDDGDGIFTGRIAGIRDGIGFMLKRSRI
jgi:hypothetical protein